MMTAMLHIRNIIIRRGNNGRCIAYIKSFGYGLIWLFFSIFVSDCPASISSNYTLVLNISSNVLAQNGGINHVLQNENVILTATAYSNDNSSNFTDIIKQSPFYFKFQYRNSSLNKHGEWSSIKCLKDKSSATVKHSWNFGGNIECLVELLTEDNETLACSSIKSIQIAGNILLNI